MSDCTRKRTRAAACAAVLFVAACTTTPSAPNAGAAYPQQAGYPQQQGYPQQAGYPPQGYQQGYPQQAAYPQQPESHPIRDLFASTIAAVLQTTTSGIAGAITGGIMNWFATKSNHGGQQNAYASSYGTYPNTGYGTTYPNSSYPTSSYPNTASTYPSTASTYPNTASTYPNTASTYPNTASTYPNTASTYPNPASTYPNTASTYPSATTSYPNSTYPSSQYPATASTYPSGTTQYPASTYPDPNAANAGYPQTSQYPNSQYPSSQYPSSTYPPQQTNGAYASNATNGAYGSTGQMVAARDTDVYAGIAYEVHALSADGHWTPVDPTTYAFKSGDRFMVYYRPSLPGRMQIYNVNPSGQQTLIDATDMAAGQLAGLGPYEFTNQTGDESLRLVLSPCSTPQLLVATRDIVKVDGPPPSSADTGGGVHLSNCSAVATRGVDIHARGIDDIGRDGLTTFALDQVSTRELASGDVDPRQVTIVFHHR